ncbi:hypothetical protein L083_4512 [Actinoplanes sp. N902-109]|nr:hypothetical protein L083_4512 [Actinoplanes sp. N902-109]
MTLRHGCHGPADHPRQAERWSGTSNGETSIRHLTVAWCLDRRERPRAARPLRSVCGGALHGWQGWVGLAAGGQQEHDDRRRRLESSIERRKPAGVLSNNARNRQAFIDLARLDIAEHLSRAGSGVSINPADPAAVQHPADSETLLSRVVSLGEAVMACSVGTSRRIASTAG